MEQFALEALKERIGQGIVVTGADPAHAAADAVPQADLGEGGCVVLGASVSVENDAADPATAEATAISITSVTSEVRMWSAIDRPTTFLEQISITVAR